MFVPYPKSSLHPKPRSEDPADVRVAARVQCVEGNLEGALDQIKPTDVVVVGYPDDRGVDRNGGRIGAAEGPDEIRRHLYKMTPPPERTTDFRIWDFGNLASWSMDLLEAHETARKHIADLRRTGARILTLGGGHDWAYPDYVGFEGHVINLDAHLDMRPNPDDSSRAGHSGTPFRRLLSEKGAPHVSAVGLQRSCNAASHLEWAHGHRVTTLFLEELPFGLGPQWELVAGRLELLKSEARYALSIDLDAFAQSEAPGVSAPQAVGVSTALALELVRRLKGQTRQLGLYELNPRFDVDGHTARLAARLAWEYLF